jgi:hypothetical protein
LLGLRAGIPLAIEPIVARPAAHHNALSVAIRSLAAAHGPACLLDASGTFLFVNEAWDRHAAENGGAPRCLGSSLIGTAWLDHIHGAEVRASHAQVLERALRGGPRPRGVTQVGESNTATRAALLKTRYAPVVAHGGDVIGVAIEHEVVRERPIEEVYGLSALPPDSYRDAAGRLTQCSCCRRVRDPEEPSRWDLVPDLVERPAPGETAHVLCELCTELHGPRDDAR